MPDKSSHRLHFVHKRSSNAKAIPLLFCHGWPGSFLEVSKIISVLTEAPSTDSGVAPGAEDVDTEHGQIAFHVVAPSIPGFGFSDASTEEGFGLKATAAVFDGLMKKLGYDEYVAHGADWGFQVCRSLALHHSGSCIAIHTTNPTFPAPSLSRSPLAFLKYHVARVTGARVPLVDFGYVPSDFQIVRTSKEKGATVSSVKEPSTGLPVNEKLGLEAQDMEQQYSIHPQTTSYSLCDSPSGLLALLLDTLHLPPSAHSTATSATSAWTPTDLLNWTMMQWLPGPEAGLRWLSQARRDKGSQWNTYSNVPLGISCFRGNGRISREPDVEAGESQDGGAVAMEDAQSDKGSVVSSPPLWGQAVQRLCWIKRHGRSAGRAGWEEAGEVGIDMREWAGQLVREGWIKTEA